MKKKSLLFLLALVVMLALVSCQNSPTQSLHDGSYTAEVTLSGGTGRASVQSPTVLTVKDGAFTAELVWSSSKYDYMVIGGEKYLPTTLEPGSTFVIPVEALDLELNVTADTTAMSEPHEIDYTLRFDSSTLKEQK